MDFSQKEKARIASLLLNKNETDAAGAALINGVGIHVNTKDGVPVTLAEDVNPKNIGLDVKNGIVVGVQFPAEVLNETK